MKTLLKSIILLSLLFSSFSIKAQNYLYKKGDGGILAGLVL
jgi:hypothetical protein